MNRRNIYLMYLISFLQGMVFYAPIATLYRRAQGVSVFEISLIETVFMLLCLGLEIPWGIVADRIGCRRTVVLCSIGYFATKVIFWQATALSINAMLVDLFSGGANLLFGGAAQQDLRLALLLGALFCAAGCGCFEYWWRKSEQK